jgi:hypothetical protein
VDEPMQASTIVPSLQLAKGCDTPTPFNT